MIKKENKIIGFHSGHDCSYSVMDKGIPVIHNELERFTRKKEHPGDALDFITLAAALQPQKLPLRFVSSKSPKKELSISEIGFQNE